MYFAVSDNIVQEVHALFLQVFAFELIFKHFE